MEQLLILLAPHLLLSESHQIIEYLVRIYEVHAHHKHTLLFCFLPYFHTSYFLRAAQLCSLKDDELFYFLH